MSHEQKFHPMVKLMHGLVAIAMIAAIVIILIAGEMPRGPEKFELYFWHKSLGVLVGGLVLFRIWAVVSKGKPKPLGKGIARLAAQWGHRLLYVAMILMPVSGFLMSWSGGRETPFFGLFTIPGASEKLEWLNEITHEVHEIAGNVVIGLIVLHVLGALYHHFIVKDKTLSRMFGR
ncbi:cytochrome b [Echinimonas agarilytica]|uniref:Cytochrome b n=1 Tax=Echinimonas agarilytica TaxID=1215918 RepID=A0AA42B8U0_9GAMM|nr:cytochrome b [Echinimonas agarilytica]MCM2681354.1 cytochrome b [Echinimonas agarilytica]